MATKEKIKPEKKVKKEVPSKTVEQVIVRSKYLRISPSKLRRVANIIRGKNVDVAMALLKNIPHKGAEILLKVLKSGIANAVNNHKLDAQGLIVSQLLISEAPRFKRFRARARGRVNHIIKRNSHVFIGLEMEGSN